MKGTVFPAASPEQDEEGAPLVPPPIEEEITEEGGTPCRDGDAAPVVAARPGRSLSSLGAVLRTRGVGSVMVGLVLLALLLGARRWIDLDATSPLRGNTVSIGAGQRRRHHNSTAPLVPIPFTCGNETSPQPPKCPGTPAPPPSPPQPTPGGGPAPSCPDYFRYIHEDLRPWRGAGITREVVERARPHAFFRLVVVGGRAFVETYRRAYQIRDVFTQWGILQLLRRYPGRVPDLDLMFACDDPGQVRAADFPRPSEAPPLFRYCKDDATLDIVFPDWSFWGWPEVNVRPWAPLLQEMDRETRRLPWPEREPYAHWKGNPGVSTQRADLLRCNVSDKMDWNARLFRQDWNAAIRGGFKDSNLAKQCAYRYKIFVQGRSWSVSEKYILACDSPMLLVATPYKDFFSRGLVAGKHYWPIDPARKCPSVKFAVDWGNAHPAQAQRMAEEGSSFAREEMSMDYVYDYMLHLLTEYARLLRYKPTIPESAVELCPESLACAAQGRERQFMMESRERFAADYEPCTLPPPFTAGELRYMARREEEVLRKVKRMEKHS